MQNILVNRHESNPDATLHAANQTIISSSINNTLLGNKSDESLIAADLAAKTSDLFNHPQQQHIEVGHNKHQDDRLEELRKEHLKHAGHENQHLAMVLILITVMTISQILLVWWKTKYKKSYIHTSMFAMYIIPFGISACRHWWRFVSIWMVISLVTIVLVWRPLVMPNFSRSGSAIPRLLYKWFFIVYSISNIVAVTGYAILLLTFFGINVLLGMSPQTSLDLGFMMLFYGIYYGVLCRDFTDFLVDKLAARIGYYNPTSALPSKLLRSNVCAICGMEHGDRENIDMDGLSKSDPLLANADSFMESDIHPDHETLIEYSEDSNHKERLFVLTCGHKFHEYCIYGWCLVGKRQVCPFCREKVDLGRLFSALPFQKPHYLYGNLLDFIRYLFAWQPIIFLAVHFLDYELGLE